MSLSNEKTNDLSIFCDRILVLSKYRKLNGRELADFLGISVSFLHRCKLGKVSISGKTWRKLEEAERKAGMRVGGEDRFQRALERAQLALGELAKISEADFTEGSSEVLRLAETPSVVADRGVFSAERLFEEMDVGRVFPGRDVESISSREVYVFLGAYYPLLHSHLRIALLENNHVSEEAFKMLEKRHQLKGDLALAIRKALEHTQKILENELSRAAS